MQRRTLPDKRQDGALGWARHWPLVDRLHKELRGAMKAEAYQRCWEHGQTLTFAGVTACLQRAFRV